MSVQKNKLIIAIATAIIAVLVLASVSYIFLPLEPDSPGSIYAMWVGGVGSTGVSRQPTIVISNDGSVDSTMFQQKDDVYTQTGDLLNQTILVNKNDIVLDGSGWALNGSRITLQACSNVTIRNMQLINAGSILLNESSNCLVTENTITKTSNIIALWLDLENSNNNAITNNSMTMANIELMFSNNNTITDNTITDAESFGIELMWSQNNTISHNYFERVLEPIEIEYGNNVISFNTIVNCTQGIRVFNSGNNVFGNNMSFADLGYGIDWQIGISVYGSNNQIFQNTITGFGLAGISIDGYKDPIINHGSNPVGSDNQIYQNIIAINRYGLLIGPEGYSTVDNNTIYHNDFINNLQNIQVCSPSSIEANNGSIYYKSNWSNGMEGNYYSDHSQKYPPAPAQVNNITTTPYIIDNQNVDLYPLAAPFNHENPADYPNPYMGLKAPKYVINQIYPGTPVDYQNRNNIYVEFYNLPPTAILTLNPQVTISNITTNLRAYTFNFAQPLPASTNYTAIVTYGQGSNIQSYTWNFSTPNYSSYS